MIYIFKKYLGHGQKTLLPNNKTAKNKEVAIILHRFVLFDSSYQFKTYKVSNVSNSVSVSDFYRIRAFLRSQE